MARLINLSTLGIGERNPNDFNDPERAHGWNDLLKILEAAPTVDAVEVVRCKDCVTHDLCIVEDHLVFAGLENPFCCAGKRKDGDENG